MADPRVIQGIRKAAQQTGADPVALLATALTEDGARPGIVGDNGTSFGPFQFHIGGALGTHAPAWADTPAAYLNRAQEFKRLGVHGGKGAAAVQRPADPAGYALKVQGNLAEARRLLGSAAPAAAPRTRAAAQQPTFQTADHADIGTSILQSLIDSSSQNAGIASIQLPQTFTPQPQATPSVQPRATQPQARTMNAFGKVTSMPNPKIIGVPFQGTHTLGNWESDRATDIAMPTGTPLYAVADGVIGSQIGSLGSNSSRFAGQRVHLKIAGNELYYAHLSRLAVKAGQRVKKGQLIGYSGSANGVQHLHLGVRSGDPRRYA